MKTTTYKKNSFNAIAFKWFYRVRDYQLPDNKCPYLWKSILMYLLAIPYYIFTRPMFIIDFFFPKQKQVGKNHGQGDVILLSIIVNGFLFFGTSLICGIALFFTEITNRVLFNMGIIGILLWCLIIMMSIGYGLSYLIRKLENRPTKPSSPNVISEYFKELRKNNCTSIEWE